MHATQHPAIAADAQRSSANFRASAMDLARRLSSLTHFVPSAKEFLASEQLQPDDIHRHGRKVCSSDSRTFLSGPQYFQLYQQIVTLIEVRD